MKLGRLAWAFPGIVALITSILLGNFIADKLYFWAIICFAIMVVAAGFDFLLREIRPWLRPEIYSLFVGVHTSQNWPPNVRICLYVRKFCRYQIVKQATPYAITGAYGSGRKGLHNSKGIVGKCFRTGQSCIELVDGNASFEACMKDKWGFDGNDLNRLQRDRKAYLCVPIFAADGKTVKAVIFLDSPTYDPVTDETRKVLERVAIKVAEML